MTRVWQDNWTPARHGGEYRLFVEDGPHAGYRSGIEHRRAGTNSAHLISAGVITNAKFERIKAVLGEGVSNV